MDVVSNCSSVSFVLEYYVDFHYLPLIKSGKKQQNNKKQQKRHSRFTFDCPGLLWNIHTVYTEKCWCTPNQFPPTKCYTPENCVSKFLLVEINFSVHLYFQCKQCNYSKVNMDTPKLIWNVLKAAWIPG